MGTSATAFFLPDDRPIIRDGEQRPRAVVLAHARDGLTIIGQPQPASSEAWIKGRTTLGWLYESVKAAAASAAEDMAAHSLPDPIALAVRSWSSEAGTFTLNVEPALLSEWVGSRAVYAELDEGSRLVHTRGLLLGFDPIFATHLGVTATVVTADGYLLSVNRQGKLLANGLSDSAIGDTVLAEELSEDGWSAVSSLQRAGRIFLGIEPEHYISLTVAMISTRIDDSGFWVSGHAHLRLTRKELEDVISERSQYPDPARYHFTPWTPETAAELLAVGEWTSWAYADLSSASAIDFGNHL